MINNEKKFVPVMLTPFNDEAGIDFDDLTTLTEYYLSSGSKGLFANCLSSEMYELSPAERIAITRHVIKVADGRVPVVATGIFERDFDLMVDNIKRMQDTGVSSIVLTTSILADQTEPDELLEARFAAILDAVGEITFGFYECPVPYKRLISPALLSRLLKSERVTYFKDTSLNLEQVIAKVNAGANHDFELYDAYMVNAVASIHAGAAGLSCIQGNYFPELIVWLCDNFDNPGLHEQVNLVQAFFNRHMEIMHKYYPSSAKKMLARRGLHINSLSRTQSAQMTVEDHCQMDKLFKDYTELESLLSITGQSHKN